MKFEIITIFPNFFESFKSEALISRAIKNKIISINTHNLRDFSGDERGTVDDRPYGGGVGMVLKFLPIFKAVKTLKSKVQSQKSKVRTILLSAKGKLFNQKDAKRLSKYDQLIFICGRYEGVDERVADHVADEEISIGEYVLFGGEVPTMVVVEAVTRLLPGAVGKEESIQNESFSKDFSKEYPQYTRPEVIEIAKKRLKVPKVLLSGDHGKILEWRKKKSIAKM